MWHGYLVQMELSA